MDEALTASVLRSPADRPLTRLAARNKTPAIVLHKLNLAAALPDHPSMMHTDDIRAEGPFSHVLIPIHLADVPDLAARLIPDPVSRRPVCIPTLAACRTSDAPRRS